MKKATSTPYAGGVCPGLFSGLGLTLSFLFSLIFFNGPELQAQVTVSSLGAQSMWYSDDTRNSSGTDLVGTTRTQYGKPGQPPTTADDIAIGQQLQFVGGPAGSTGGGTVKIIAPTGNPAKSTLSTVNLAGFVPASDLTGGSFTANYRWYMEPNPTTRTVAFRIGIQSTQWAASQASFTATRSGEQTWDLILVHVMSGAVANAWNDVNVDKDNGTWYLYGQAGNGNWVGIAGSAPPGGSMQKTLADWAADVTWGPILFGAGAKVTNVQFGLGSGQQLCNAYVDYLTTTILNSGNTINFAAPVRVYSDLAETTLVGGYETIQAAINDATTLNGYVVRVSAGTYYEKLTVNKSLHIRGTEATCILDGTGLGTGSGITITNGTTGVSISGLTIRNHAGTSPNSYAGIYATGGNNNLTVENCTIRDNLGGSGFYANGPVDNVTLNNLEVFGHTNVAGAARGIVIWNGLKSNITITNCDVYNNNCCGIELQDGTATGVTMSNNNVYNNGDNGIGIVGMQGPGANLLSGNTLANNGRFGMEIKNPNGSGANSGAGSIVVQNNTVTRTNPIGAEARDIAGIAVMRRGVLAGNVDVPTGVVVTGNTVSGYVQPSNSDGFGIVISGTNHTVTGNTVSGNDVGIQQQAGHTPYPGDGDQNNLADQYFGRDNSPAACGNTISSNTFSSNGVDERNVGGPFGNGFVSNTNTGKTFCTIQAAINDVATVNGHTILVSPGTYAENVLVNKSLDIRGPNYGISPNTGIRVAEAIIVPLTSDPVNINIVSISASNTFFNGFTIDGDNPSIGVAKDALRGVYVSTNGLNNVRVSNNIVKNLEGSGIRFQQATNFFATTVGATFSSDNVIDDNLIENITSLGVDLRQSMYTKVINNVISNVRYGIYVNSFRISDPGNPANRIISGNIIQSRQWGIWFNLYAAAHYETSNNTITAIADATRAKWYGIMLSTVSSPQNALSQLNLPLASTPGKWSLINNSINGSNLDPATSGIGYWLWYVDNNRDNSSNDHYGIISGGSVSNVDIGLYMHNVDTDPSTNFGQGRTGAHASVSNVNFSVNAGGKGIHLKDDPTWMTANIAPLVAKRNVNATINNCYITGGADGVLLEESEDDKVSAPMNNNSITGQTGLAIIATTLNSTVNANCNWYGTAVYGDLPAKIAGNVDYIPYLNNGMDDNIVAGFQPVSGSCIDGPVRVYSDNTETTLLSTHVTIQAGVNAAVNGNVVRVDAGTYNEDVNVNKIVAVKGAGMDQSIVSGPIGGDGATFRVASPGVVIDGFTITRDGNNLTDWNNGGLNFAGVAIQGQANDGEIRNCKIIGNRTGIDVNDSDGNNIHNNVINFNRTGLLFRNRTDNTILIENEIADNWAVGILFLDASGGTNSPVQSALNSQFNNNNISGNWYGQIVDRQTGGSLPAPGTTNMKNFDCNWYGTTTPVVSTANSAEPGYSALIPVLYGGSSTPPGGQPDILGAASANFDYLPYLIAGADSDLSTAGFQPAAGTCTGAPVQVFDNTMAFVSGHTTIQAAINSGTTLNGYTINVTAGTYAENVTISKSLTLNGPNADIACGSRVAEALIAPASGVPITVTADDVTINGFEVTAPSSVYGINFGNTSNGSIKFNNIHDIGTSVTNANVHAILYTVGSASKSGASVTDNCLDNISSTALTGWSASAIGILQSASTGVLTGLNIERNTINDVQVNTGDWPTGKIAYGIIINVGGGSGYLTTSGEVVDAVIRNNEISNVSGFIATGIGMEGNTKNAIVENNSVAGLNGRKVGGTRAAGGFDLSALKIENNRWVGTLTIQNNSFQTNTFTHDMTAGLGYAVSNYVPAGTAFTGGGGGTTGAATISCNWLGTATYSLIQDNPTLTGKIFNKDNCITNFAPYLINGNDDNVAIGFQPEAFSCKGGPVQVYNGNTLVSGHALIQEAIDAATTLSGYIVRIASGTYVENVDAVTGGKNLIFAPGASPGCVTINGNLTLNAGDVLEIEIEGTTPCTEHDQFTVTGTVTLGGATIMTPLGMYFAQPGDEIKVIDASSAIAGVFAEGNFVTDGVNTYYINYAGGDGNDVVLTKCCGGLLDLGIFNHNELTPAGNKLRVFVKPNMDVINGAYSAGVFTIRTLTSNGVTFTNLGTLPHAYTQVDEKTDAGYTYYFFSYVGLPGSPTDPSYYVNWNKDDEIPLLTLSYNCSKAGVVFELANDAFTIANNGAYYQELGGAGAQGVFYQATATSPAALSLIADNNGPVCNPMLIALSSTASNGTPAYTYAWSGPDAFSSTDANPAPFASAPAKDGIYAVTVTDANGCTATATTDVEVLNNAGCVENVTLTTYYPTITQAIDATETVNGHVLKVPAGNWPENVNVTKALTINGANMGVACDGSRGPESVIMGTTAVTISSNGVTIDGFQIEGITGVSAAGFTAASIINNKFDVLFTGIASSLVTTSATDGFVIQDNCVVLADQTYDTQGFASNPTLAATQTPGAWYTDRYAPAGFMAETFGGNSRLKHSISAADCESCRPGGFTGAFYNTQGRKYDIAGTTAMSIDLYVPSGWATTGRRMAGFWGTAVDGGNAITRYPILEFTSDGANPRFRVWDNGTWIDLGLPTGFAYDQWYTLQIALLADGQFMCSVGDLSLAISGGGSTSISNVILQGHNTASPGVTYDIYWDNFNAYDAPVAQNAPTYGIALTAATGTQAVVLKDNNITNAFYGYAMGAVNTTARTTVEGGSYTNLMQGVAVANTLDGVTYVPSTVGVKDLSMTSFTGNYPAIAPANFHSGVYVFTGGANPAAAVDILVDNVVVSNTGKISPNSAGIHFADFSTGAGNRLNAVVQNSEISSNLNRGVQVRGANATALVKNNEILFNGSDPYGVGGNDGFGIYAGVGAVLTLNNNTITNPAAQAGSYPVTAIFNGVAPAATIIAFENSINRNGNGSLTANTYPIAQFTATCNWWQSADIDVVDGLVDGNVLFVPYLIDGTDTDMGARGFVPVANSCVNPTRWYVNDNALTDDVYTLGLGNDANQGTKRRPFRTISKAVMTAVSADKVYVDAGSYNEQVVIPNTKDNMEIIGVGPCTVPATTLTTMVDFTGTVTGKPTLFDIAGDGTIIDGIHFKVDLSKLNSAIIASDAGLDNITVKNNCIDPYQSVAGTNFGSYGNRNAISINYGGSTNFRVAAGGVDNIIADNNRVTATVNGTILGDDAADIAFRSAISVDEGAGTYTRNTFQTINHDILVRFNNNGPVVIGGSGANANTFLGGGVQYSDPNPGGGTVTISHNAFDGSVSGSVLRLQNNYTNAAVSVANNTLSNVRWGMSLENFRNATVSDNVLSPLAGFSNFRLITVNTKSISSNSSTILQVPIDGVFTGNTFNAGTPGTGTALAFYNHDSDAATLGSFTIGTAGSPNVFAPGFLYAVYLGDQTGNTTDAPALALFPEYNLGGGSTTLMACWTRDINIEKNSFDLGAGAQFPQFMNNAQRNALETILYHLPDNACLGELIYFVPTEIMAKVFLQGPFDSVTGLMNDNLRAANLLPVDEPYTAINTTNAGSFVEVNNFVNETGVAPAVFAVTGNNAIVDWIWLELRSKSDNELVLATRSALVQRDGDVVDLDGVSPVLFPDSYADDYYLMVRHRNHLGAMTATAVDFTSPVVVDFTTASQATFGTTPTSARRLIRTATYGLWAGNTVPKSGINFEVKYNGGGNDRLPILNVVGILTPLNLVNGVYALEDLNLDGQVKYNGANNDRVIILNNVGPATPLNVITQQPNN